MATFKAEIPYLKEDGTARVIIRLTHKRQLKYINTDIYLTRDDLTKSGKVKSDSIKDDIEAIVKQYRDEVRALGLRVEAMTAEQVKAYLLKKCGADSQEIEFIAYGRAKVEQMKRERMPLHFHCRMYLLRI